MLLVLQNDMSKIKLVRLTLLEKSKCQVSGCYRRAILRFVTPKLKRRGKVISELCMICVGRFMSLVKIEDEN
jgi:hypothetical protein